ncbi:Lipoate-protein ligase LplJ [Novipirellula aureliae]|uniref:Lipoate-protein ligase LplJ n=1 Tax=Novipirellula aureliae TaxID=2527966 RepID=A0A5C6DK62_9BACT|nr:lipoate--protein ligase family protein [Novipirellula aureliae]TWU35316.1 Lipoate-protein ligase LplJ [Novipirellula aureliae]
MLLIPESLFEPADQLAMDEALLVWAEEQTDRSYEFLRLWEFAGPTVVLGRSSRVDEEIDVPYCESHSIPIFRRCSGGASIVGGPGCLMYSVVLDLNLRPELSQINACHDFVMQRLTMAMQKHAPEIAFQGICDLTIGNRKFSGNSMRMIRRHVLYHGTILYSADLELIAKCLRTAPRQPEYRSGRDHDSFITNINVDAKRIESEIQRSFAVNAKRDSAKETILLQISERSQLLKQERYEKREWNFLR